MFQMRYVCKDDKRFWDSLDEHLSESEFERKIRDKRGYIISDNGIPVGIMRYNLFCDNTPFVTLIYLKECHRGKGFGKRAMLQWEKEMREQGFKMTMTSTQVDEEAQHFYRKIGYIDKGGLFLDNTPFEQPQEMFMIKII